MMLYGIQRIHAHSALKTVGTAVPEHHGKLYQLWETVTVLTFLFWLLSGEALGPRRFGLSAGIDPTYRGPASLEAVSESSVSAAQVALQGLTCD